MLEYRLKFENDDNGTILVTSPDFPLVTFGEDRADAERRAGDAAHALLQSMMDDREEIPQAGRPKRGEAVLRLPLQTALKVTLYAAMRGAGLTRADMVRLLGWKRESVDRLFRLDHNSKVEQIDEAFRALKKEVKVVARDRETADVA